MWREGGREGVWGLRRAPEVLGVLDDAVAQLDADAAALFERLLEQQRLQQRVQLLADILQQHLPSEPDRSGTST